MIRQYIYYYSQDRATGYYPDLAESEFLTKQKKNQLTRVQCDAITDVIFPISRLLR
jgi:hypothetical protein